MTSIAEQSKIDPAQDPAIDRRSRAFLSKLNEDSSPFWELPGDEPRNLVTALQNRTPVDMFGIEVDERRLTVAGWTIGLYVVRPKGASNSVRAFMEYGWDHYAPDAEDRKHRYAAPLHATIEQLRGLPPTLIQIAENDVLRDEGEAYARRLDEAGVDVTCVR